MGRELNEGEVLVSALKEHHLSLEYKPKRLQWLGREKAPAPGSTSQRDASSWVLPEAPGQQPQHLMAAHSTDP